VRARHHLKKEPKKTRAALRYDCGGSSVLTYGDDCRNRVGLFLRQETALVGVRARCLQNGFTVMMQVDPNAIIAIQPIVHPGVRWGARQF